MSLTRDFCSFSSWPGVKCLNILGISPIFAYIICLLVFCPCFCWSSQNLSKIQSASSGTCLTLLELSRPSSRCFCRCSSCQTSGIGVGWSWSQDRMQRSFGQPKRVFFPTNHQAQDHFPAKKKLIIWSTRIGWMFPCKSSRTTKQMHRSFLSPFYPHFGCLHRQPSCCSLWDRPPPSPRGKPPAPAVPLWALSGQIFRWDPASSHWAALGQATARVMNSTKKQYLWGNWIKLSFIMKKTCVLGMFMVFAMVIFTGIHHSWGEISQWTIWHVFDHPYITGNFRTLKWSYCTIFLAIFWGL